MKAVADAIDRTESKESEQDAVGRLHTALCQCSKSRRLAKSNTLVTFSRGTNREAKRKHHWSKNGGKKRA